MPGKLLWGDIMELEAPLEETESQRKERQKSDRRKSRHHYDSDEKSETRENGVTDDLDAPKPKKAKMKEKLNGDTEEGCDRLSDEFSKSHKPRRKDLSNGDIDEHEKRSKRVSSLNSSTHKSSDNKVEETLTREQKEGAFSNFPISEETIKLLKGRGVTYLFPIQVKTFGPVYEGKDLIAQARTGTGKTFSFAIPLIERLQRNQETIKKSRSPKVTIIGSKRFKHYSNGKRKKEYTGLENFLVVQWLGLGASTDMTLVQTVVRELRSRKLHGTAQKKKNSILVLSSSAPEIETLLLGIK